MITCSKDFNRSRLTCKSFVSLLDLKVSPSCNYCISRFVMNQNFMEDNRLSMVERELTSCDKDPKRSCEKSNEAQKEDANFVLGG